MPKPTLSVSTIKRIIIIVLCIIALVVLLLLLVQQLFLQPSMATTTVVPNGVEVIQFDDSVRIQRILNEGETAATEALVYYPGGLVESEAYIYTLAPIVSAYNIAIIIPDMPQQLAVFDINAVNRIIQRNSQYSTWYIGGHSLGGAMACRHLAASQFPYAGLVLSGSFCDKSISDYPGKVLSLYGSEDGLLKSDDVSENASNLPVTATTEIISGMNHAQFGAYGKQSGDNEAFITNDAATQQVTERVVGWLEQQ